MTYSFASLTGKSRWTALLAGTICGFAMISNLHAQNDTQDAASAQISDVSLGGGEFDYTIKLTNNGTNNLETFWYSWVPGQDFMPVSPTNIVTPTDWTANITNAGSSDGFAIQFLTSSSSTPAPLAPGQTDVFSFESTATPAQIAGDSTFHPTMLDDTAFVYSGAPFSDSGFELQVESAPEPSSVAFFFFGALALGFGIWRRRRPAGVTARS